MRLPKPLLMRDAAYLIVVVFALIFFYLFHTPVLLSESLWPDEALYAWISQQFSINPTAILSQEALAYQPPFYPIILSMGKFLAEGLMGYHAVSLIIALGGIIGIYLLGRIFVNGFVGAFAALALSLNNHYFASAGRILTDIPLLVAVVFFMWGLISWARCGFSFSKGVLVGILGAAALLIKWPGALLIIPLIYYCTTVSLSVPLVRRFRLTLIPLSMILIAAMILLYLSCWRFGEALPNCYVFKHAFIKQSPYFYALSFTKLMGSVWMSVLSIVGILFILLQKDAKSLRVLLVWVFSFVLVFSFAQEKQLRYGLIFLPGCLLLAGIGAHRLIAVLLPSSWMPIAQSFVLVMAVCLGLWHVKPLIQSQDNKILTYTGFREAGEWLLHNAKNAQIWVGSQRAMRYYTGINFNPLPPSLDTLVDTGKVFMVVDLWEYTQPGWVYPLTQEKLDYLSGQGFDLVKVIYKPMFLSQGSDSRQVIPVIWIFEKKS